MPVPYCRSSLPDSDVIADLFNWALKRDVVTADQARKCAKRGTGRPWEAVWSQVYSLGVYPDKWPVPLQRDGVLLIATAPDERRSISMLASSICFMDVRNWVMLDMGVE